MGQRIVALTMKDQELSLAAALEWSGSPLLGRDAGEVAGVGAYEDALRLSVPCLSGRFRMLNMDALIAAKQATGRRRDFEAIHWLRSIKEKREQPKD